MECIRVRVEQLGRLRSSEVVVSPLMVFSGESGLGKSYLALLCHYFFELQTNVDRINHFFIGRNIDYNMLSREFNDSGIALEIKKKELEEWMSKDAILYLRYMLGHEELSGNIHVLLPDTFPETMIYTYKKELSGLVDSEDIYTILTLGPLSYRIQEKTQFDESPFSILLRYVMRYHIFGDHLRLDSTFVLPPSRGPVMTEQIIPTTGMYSEFLRDMATLSRTKPMPDSASKTVLELFNVIMEGEVSRKDARYIYTTTDASMPVSAAAASIREIAPLQILAKKHDVSKCAILVEEPEAHLHPLKQRMMADIIGGLCHNGAVLQITTHSDYFLRRLNELIMYANACQSIEDKEKLKSLAEKLHIVKEITIDVSSVGAYLLLKNEDGTSRAIKQDLAEGIPFTAFWDAITDNLNNQDLLSEFS